MSAPLTLPTLAAIVMEVNARLGNVGQNIPNTPAGWNHVYSLVAGVVRDLIDLGVIPDDTDLDLVQECIKLGDVHIHLDGTVTPRKLQ